MNCGFRNADRGINDSLEAYHTFFQIGTGMKDETEEKELEEAKDLFKEGLSKLFKATGKISREIIKGFKEGYTNEKETKDE